MTIHVNLCTNRVILDKNTSKRSIKKLYLLETVSTTINKADSDYNTA